ncbi:hypothetical protein [Metabacillus litoralis]|uniref:hypothetical protein n=1 Tax=Metabacillus litoralis TaxID=152268 RepID=UPI001CFDF1B5|nr:hypothetical protein [Metabacillus litoralis]
MSIPSIKNKDSLYISPLDKTLHQIKKQSYELRNLKWLVKIHTLLNQVILIGKKINKT